MNKPVISYLVSTYDGGRFLNTRLNNLLCEQTQENIEVIIVNPNSPGTDDIIAKSWAEKDSRINYIELPIRETYGCSWIRAFEVAKGEFCCNANVDDLMDPHFTEKIYAFFIQQQPNIAFCYTDLYIVQEATGKRALSRKQPFDLDYFTRNCTAGPAVTWRNDDKFRSLMDWDLMKKRAAIHTSAYDYWQWLYFCSLGFEGAHLPEPLISYLQRPSSLEHQNYGTYSTWQSLASIAEFYPRNFATHLPEKEFANFPIVPDKDSWVEARKAGKTWKDNKYVNIND